MRAQQDNKIVTSFLLMVDHEIQKQGQAFANRSGLFYPTTGKIAGQYTYACSYKQLCNDVSITGANVMSGVYLNGNYVGIGQSGLTAINHYEGFITFSNALPANTRVSGNFGVKEFSVYLSDQPDYKIVMDTKFHSNPKYLQQATGIPLEVKSMPAVILVPKDQEARPLAFAGIDDNYMRIRAVVVCENAFQRVAVCNILKNFRLKQMPLFNNVPFDYLGNMTGLNYNYTTLTFDGSFFPYIMSAKAIDMPSNNSYVDATRQFGMVDFDISTWGGHL